MNKTYHLTLNSIFISIFLIFTLTPIGYLPFGPIKITLMPLLFLIVWETIHLATKANLVMIAIIYSFLFGLSSLMQAVLYPSITTFIFINPLFSIVSRILMGLVTAIVELIIKDLKIRLILKKLILVFCVVTLNTLFVLLFIFNLAFLIDPNLANIFTVFSWMILITNYLPELILSALIYPIIALAIKRIY